MRDKVTRIRALLEEAKPSRHRESTAEAAAARGFRHFEGSDPFAYVLDQSPRARTYREVIRLATRYGWQREVDSALDRARAMTLATMSDEDLEQLLQRLRTLEDCLHNGIGSPDAPPAY